MLYQHSSDASALHFGQNEELVKLLFFGLHSHEADSLAVSPSKPSRPTGLNLFGNSLHEFRNVA